MGQDSHYLTKWLSFIQSYVEDGFDNLLDKIGLFFLDFQALTKILEWYVSTEKKDCLSMEELPEVCPQFHIFYHKKFPTSNTKLICLLFLCCRNSKKEDAAWPNLFSNCDNNRNLVIGFQSYADTKTEAISKNKQTMQLIS